MADPCPRCGAERRGADVCAACGYAPSHPGVLGSLAAGARTLVRRPPVLIAFALPALLLVGLEVLFEDPTGSGTGFGLATLISLYLPTVLYLFVVGAVAPGVSGRGPPINPGALAAGASLGAVLIVAPLALIAALASLGATGTVGALASITVLVVLVAGLVVAGRAVGIPVEAALHPGDARVLLRRGLRRGKENGGLGLVFLALVLFAASVLLLAWPGLAGRPLPEPWLLTLSGVRTWWLGAWIGTALVHAMAQGDEPPTRFTCPRCGRSATAHAGRARCECGLEGPMFVG